MGRGGIQYHARKSYDTIPASWVSVDKQALIDRTRLGTGKLDASPRTSMYGGNGKKGGSTCTGYQFDGLLFWLYTRV